MQAQHTQVILQLPRTHAAFIAHAQHIVAMMTGNAHFPNPQPPLATVTASIQTLVDAQTKAQAHTAGAAAARDVALQTLATELHQLQAHVQSVADTTPAEAAAIASSAGMGTHAHGARMHPDLAIRMAPGGLVVLHKHSAGKHASYEWQYTTDGKTWTSAPSTDHAHTTISGLTVGQSYQFRARGNVGDTVGDWVGPITFLVH